MFVVCKYTLRCLVGGWLLSGIYRELYLSRCWEGGRESWREGEEIFMCMYI